jgi:hypothetical protein
MRNTVVIVLGLLVGATALAHDVLAQHPMASHGHPTSEPAASAQPTQPGQATFAAIAEVVRLLDADPATDWSTIDLERLRQHLIDMDEVVLHSVIKQTPVPGGLAMDVTGTGRTLRAIRAMVTPHATELDHLPAYRAKADAINGGVRLTVTAENPDDARAVARLRGLGFIGLLTEGGHHGPHHLMLAKGTLRGHGH